MELQEILKELRQARNLTQQQAARELEVARTTYASYEQGLREPDIETINKISSLYYVPTDILLGTRSEASQKRYLAFITYLWRNNLDEIIIGEQGVENHMKLYDSKYYDFYTRLKAEETLYKTHIDLITETTEYDQTKMKRLPVLGSVRAGSPMEMIENDEGYTLVDPEVLRGRDGFALRVNGDSMSGDRIHEGDLVVVVRQEEVQPHEIAVVAINGDEATIKRVRTVGDVTYLIPSNPNYPHQEVHSKDIHILGKVVQLIVNLT